MKTAALAAMHRWPQVNRPILVSRRPSYLSPATCRVARIVLPPAWVACSAVRDTIQSWDNTGKTELMNPAQQAIDWHQMFVPTGSLLELMMRGSLMYLLILAGFRIFRRDAGSLSVSDLLVVVLIADAAQNGMAGEYKSLTEGAVVVTTIFAWNYVLDWLAYRSRFVYWLLHPPSLLLIRNGQIQFRNLRSQLITKEDLLQQLREQGVEDVTGVKRCFLESDGRMSVIRLDDDHSPRQQAEKRRF
jgi:uncharacterized membrane protein YcaP (DUF421 family)